MDFSKIVIEKTRQLNKEFEEFIVGLEFYIGKKVVNADGRIAIVREIKHNYGNNYYLVNFLVEIEGENSLRRWFLYELEAFTTS